MGIQRVGILTGGGDCPGLNAVIRAVVRKGIDVYGYQIIGILEGWRGMLEGISQPLDLGVISGILPKGGTILSTSRTNPFKEPDGEEAILENMKQLKLDALIAVGGDDTIGVADRLYENHGINIVGIPKTIDNDVAGTDYTFGFDTAINIVMEALDRLHSTAEAHNRVMVVEVMGRDAGWIAVEAGISGGADIILIPEEPFDIEEICALVEKRHKRGKTFSIIVAAEGSTPKGGSLVTQGDDQDAFGHARLGGIGTFLSREIEKRTGFETRTTVLGHIQRGGSPTAFDRVLGTRFGIAAIDLVHKEDFGKMVCLRGLRIDAIRLKDAVAEPRTVDKELYEIAKVFFG